jgi:hypothetical protein
MSSIIDPPPLGVPPLPLPPEPGQTPADPAGPGMLVAFPPTLADKLSLTSNDDLEDDVKIDRAVDGTGRARSFYIQPKHHIGGALRGIDEAEWATLDAFYRANRIQPFTIPWGPCGSPAPLPVLFSSPPKRVFHGLGLSTATVDLVEFP